MFTLEHRIESYFDCLTIPRKQVQDPSKKFLQNKNNNKKDFLEKPPVTMIISW